MSEILRAIFCVLRGGIEWRLIPQDLPARSARFGEFSRWRDAGLFGWINHTLVMADRERVGRVLRLSRRTFPSITKASADAGYAGDRPATATSITVDIVHKPKDQVGFSVHPHRWVVERFTGWISRDCHLRRAQKRPSPTPRPSSTPHPSISTSEAWAERQDLSDEI